MLDHTLVLLALRAQLLTAAGIPDANNRAFENLRFQPTTGTPFLEEDFVPATAQVTTFPAVSGTLIATGLYVVKVYVPANSGPTTVTTIGDAILGVFKPGTTLNLSNGDVVRIRTDVAPTRGQLRSDGTGWAALPITVPYRVTSTNA